MEKSIVYYFLICFTIFTFIKKILGAIIESDYPIRKEAEKAGPIWKIMSDFRFITNVLSLIFITTFLLSVKLNIFLYTILVLLLIGDIEYFLVDCRFITYILNIDNNNYWLKYLDKNFSLYFDSLFSIFSLYAITEIFYN